MEAVLEIIMISAGLSLASTFVSKKLVNQDKVKEKKETIKQFQKKYNAAKAANNQAEVQRLAEEQKQVMKLTGEIMKESFKPTLITFLPFIAVFMVMRDRYGSLGNLASVPMLNWLDWLGVYIVSMLITTVIIEIAYKAITKKPKNAPQIAVI